MQRQTANKLRSVYVDFTEEEIRCENDRVFGGTRIEREWIDQSRLTPYPDINSIQEDPGLVRVDSGPGYRVINSLRYWEPERDNPDHPNHYSPPFLKKNAFSLLEHVGGRYAEEFGDEQILAVTSLVRHAGYQESIARAHGKIAIDPTMGSSSHLYGLAFDIDACGLYMSGEGRNHSINPNQMPEEEYESYFDTVVRSREFVMEVLQGLAAEGRINFIRELPGTKQDCIHVCVKPSAQQAPGFE